MVNKKLLKFIPCNPKRKYLDAKYQNIWQNMFLPFSNCFNLESLDQRNPGLISIKSSLSMQWLLCLFVLMAGFCRITPVLSLRAGEFSMLLQFMKEF